MSDPATPSSSRPQRERTSAAPASRPSHMVKTVTAPNLNVTTYSYDALHRVTRIDDSVGLVATYTYDLVGNRLSERDGNGNGSNYTYDAIYRVTAVTDALGNTTQYSYNAVGNLLQTTDRNGNVTAYDYDAINRRIETTDARSEERRVGKECRSRWSP